MAQLDRPLTEEYHAGPWISDMRRRKGTGQWMFFGRFLWWSSVEVYIREQMRHGEPWGCEE